MQNSREWYEAKALESLDAATTAGEMGQREIMALGLSGAQVYATLANAADRRSHGSITDEPSKRITP